MSDKKDNSQNIPLECPSRNQKIITDPIVDVVEKETYPPENKEVINIISKAQQGQQSTL